MKNRARLEAYLRTCEGMAVDYARFDCVRFITGWLELNGRQIDLPVWSTPQTAVRAIRKEGGRKVTDLVTSRLGAPVAPYLAPWGSIASFDRKPFDALGIVDGSRVVALSPLGGFHSMPLRAASFAWCI
jgi:hypothetical protein